MNDVALAVGGLILGIVASVIVSNYYFRKSHSKSLTPYIQYSSSPFRYLDPAVRRALNIQYQGVQVEDLFEIQFLIANTGDKAIRDVIDPLTLPIPKGCGLLDAAIIHRSPEQLRVSATVSADKGSVITEFPLLNKGDFFILKLLLNGIPKDADINFYITVDELPPTLKAEQLPHDVVGTTTKRKLEIPMLGVGLGFVFFGLVLIKVVYDGWSVVPGLKDGITVFLSSFTTDAIAIVLSVIPAFFFTLFGAMFSAAALADGNFPPKKKKFIIPEHIHGRGFRLIVREEAEAKEGGV